MITKDIYSFQVDSELVQNVYHNNDNYIIEYSNEIPRIFCVIYFTSNDLYFPNSENAFRKRIVERNYFEWYKTRINCGYKHIFIRDIHKQFYLAGVNSKLNNPQKLLSFLKKETSGYKIITIGSSGGGYSAIIFGQLLKSEKIYSFNGSFEISSKLTTSTESKNPLVFRNKENKELKLWYDSRNYITDPSSIYYFQSIKSKWDMNQFNHVKDININRIQFVNSKHGIPFLKSNLPTLLTLSTDELKQLTKKVHNPVIFSIKMIGFTQTITSILKVIKLLIKRLIKRSSEK